MDVLSHIHLDALVQHRFALARSRGDRLRGGPVLLDRVQHARQALYDGFLQEAGVSLPVTISGIIALAVAVSAFVMSEGDIRRFFERRKARRQPADDEEAFARCARRAAREFGLSNREEEIAVLVMKGKNNAVIEKLLCITESTLRTPSAKHLRESGGP